MTRPICIVTGSSSGIGAATVELFAQRGWDVVINYSRDPAPAKSVAERCQAAGAQTLVVKADVADDAQCKALVQAVRDKWGRADALVNNAGTTKFTNIKDLDALSGADFLNIYGVNVVGTYQMSRAVAPLMAASGNASITNISSMSSLNGGGSSIAYAASKGAINTLTLALAKSLAPKIRVNAILPGMVNSDWLRKGLGSDRYAAAEKHYTGRALLNKVIDPHDAATTAYWLATDAVKVTAQLIQLESGFLVA